MQNIGVKQLFSRLHCDFAVITEGLSSRLKSVSVVPYREIILQKISTVSHWGIFAIVFFGVQGMVCSQSLAVRVRVSSIERARARVELDFPIAVDILSFRNTYGGIVGLGERIENVEARGLSGEPVSVRRLAPGEFRAAVKVLQFAYDVRLNEPSRPAEMSHISWLNRENGLVLMADLLPRPREVGKFANAVLELKLPAGWKTFSAAKRDPQDKYLITDPDKAVFLISNSLREQRSRIGSAEFVMAAAGDWPFAGGEVVKIATRILNEYREMTGFQIRERVVLILLPYRGEVGTERWSAETRGYSVVLLMGRRATRKQLLHRIGIVLSHELLHLWVPNSLALEGEYDWFFEGFTLYQALLTSVRLGFIRFSDYLETLARVYDSYRNVPDRDRLSLIEASKQRWTTSSSLVYDKGMLAAFICDLTLRSNTNEKTSLNDVYRKLFQTDFAERRNANDLIISILKAREELNLFLQQYVLSAGRIDLGSLLKPFGIELQFVDSHARLEVLRSIHNPQLRVLRSIGYKP